jgi:uncharacterized protein YbjT (DUF2867 family)
LRFGHRLADLNAVLIQVAIDPINPPASRTVSVWPHVTDFDFRGSRNIGLHSVFGGSGKVAFETTTPNACKMLRCIVDFRPPERRKNSTPMDIQNVLAAQPRVDTAPSTRRRVIVFGNAGTLGEALLARLISAPRYARVYAATAQPIRSTAHKLSYCLLDELKRDLRAEKNWPAIDEAVIVVGGKPSFFKRDDVFPAIDETTAITLTRACAAAGARRMMVIAPMEAWLATTLGRVAGFGPLENTLRELDFETAWIIRPSEHDRAAAKGSVLQRIAHNLLGTLGHYMTPQSLQPLRAHIVAEAAVEWFTSDASGYQICGARELYHWMETRNGPQSKT